MPKLVTIFDYANFFTTALKNQPTAAKRFTLKYLDAFAGSGAIKLSEQLPNIAGAEDFSNVIEGSARRALQVDYPFDEYIFSDVKRGNLNSLESLKSEFVNISDRINIWHGDANDIVRKFCNELKNMDRAIVFLDPFGNQVNFDTLKIISKTGKIDLWYLFPAWWGVVRQISSDGKINPDAEASLDRVYGTTEWRNLTTRIRAEPDLFDRDRVVSEKIATVDSMTRFMIERMKVVFGEGVSDRWLPLGRNGQAGYSLIFACANKTEKARKLAHRVAKHVMKRG